MTSLPSAPPQKRLGLVVDLDLCVGCQACAVACRARNASAGSPSPSLDLTELDAAGIWFNRVHTFEVAGEDTSRVIHLPRMCLHCEDAACVTVCPSGASQKRAEDGIVWVDESRCIGCKLCSWACPYGAREFDPAAGVMRKCALCMDRIYDAKLPPQSRVPACIATCPASARLFGDLGDPRSEASRQLRERGGCDQLPELGYAPTVTYLQPRKPASCPP